MTEPPCGTENLVGHPLFKEYCSLPESSAEKREVFSAMSATPQLCKIAIAVRNHSAMEAGGLRSSDGEMNARRPCGGSGYLRLSGQELDAAKTDVTVALDLALDLFESEETKLKKFLVRQFI